ncbi:hypothetical protein FRC03_011948 [Tulasnella sp. 419]|nr:hypothetical protein FRC03_011948 [Tulasnella sp. 419]
MYHELTEWIDSGPQAAQALQSLVSGFPIQHITKCGTQTQRSIEWLCQVATASLAIIVSLCDNVASIKDLFRELHALMFAQFEVPVNPLSVQVNGLAI